jgi:hypothetical protein
MQGPLPSQTLERKDEAVQHSSLGVLEEEDTQCKWSKFGAMKQQLHTVNIVKVLYMETHN